MDAEGTWTPQPLPLYDSNGDLVLPDMYTATLPGSLVSITFTVTRHMDAISGLLRYRANVEEMNILDRTTVEMGTSTHTKLVNAMRMCPPKSV